MSEPIRWNKVKQPVKQKRTPTVRREHVVVGASFTDKLDSNKLGGQRVVDRNSFEEEKQENKANPQESNQKLGPEQDSAGGSFSFEGMLGQIQSFIGRKFNPWCATPKAH